MNLKRNPVKKLFGFCETSGCFSRASVDLSVKVKTESKTVVETFSICHDHALLVAGSCVDNGFDCEVEMNHQGEDQ